MNINIFDQSQATDMIGVIKLLPPRQIGKIEFTTPTELITIQSRQMKNINVFDSLTVTESLTIRLVYYVNVLDSLTVTESVIITPRSYNIIVFESSSITENVTIVMINNLSVTDSSTITEVPFSGMNPDVDPSINVFDASQATDLFLNSLSFNGTTAFVNVPFSASLQPANFSVSAWINATSLGGSDFLSDVVATEGANSGYALRVGAGTTNFMVGSGSGTPEAKDPSVTIVTGTWFHIAGTYDGANIKVYVNGILRATTASGSFSASSNALHIGDTPGAGGRNFAGNITDVRVYSAALSQAQITTLFQLGQTSVDLTKMAAWWHMDEGSGTTILDASGNSQTGTLSGSTTPTWSTTVPQSPAIVDIKFINVNDSSTVADLITQILVIDIIGINENSIVLDVRRNYITNPSDEGSGANETWTKGGTVASVTFNSTDQAFKGTQSIKFIQVASNCFTYQDITVVPGTTYKFSAYIYISTLTLGTFGINLKPTNFSFTYASTNFISTTGTWTQVTGTYTAGSETVVRLILDSSGPATGTAYFDAIQMEATNQTAYFDGDQTGVQWDGSQFTSTSSTAQTVNTIETIKDESISDSSTVTENITVTLIQEPVISDSSTVTESITVILIQKPIIFDSSTITDNIITLQIYVLNIFDSSAATEAITMSVVDLINVFDSSAVAESLILLFTEFESIFEASTVTENFTMELIGIIGVQWGLVLQ